MTLTSNKLTIKPTKSVDVLPAEIQVNNLFANIESTQRLVASISSKCFESALERAQHVFVGGTDLVV